jgi:RhtB (resistance to homoserine/threonine) family protein
MKAHWCKKIKFDLKIIGRQVIMNLIFLLLSVASIWSVAVITPGPNFFITAQITVKHSRLAGLFIVLGTCSGTIIWSAAGYFGIAFLFIMAPWIYTTLKIVGGSYIIYLGIMLIINSYRSRINQHVALENSVSNYLNWRKGLITNLSNPKTAMFITSLFASVLPKEPTISIAILIITLMVLISLIWYSFVVFIFSSKKFKCYYNQMQKWLEGIAGVIFMGFGAKLVFSSK